MSTFIDPAAEAGQTFNWFRLWGLCLVCRLMWNIAKIEHRLLLLRVEWGFSLAWERFRRWNHYIWNQTQSSKGNDWMVTRGLGSALHNNIPKHKTPMNNSMAESYHITTLPSISPNSFGILPKWSINHCYGQNCAAAHSLNADCKYLHWDVLRDIFVLRLESVMWEEMC